MKRFISFFALLASITPFICGFALASSGHDHSHDAATQTAAASALPRFEAHSESFEVVGVLHGDELSVFVDRFDSNTPVLGAKLELESGAAKAVGQFHEDHGDYSFAVAPFKKPGSHPIILTIADGEDIDMLAANLVVPQEVAPHAQPSSFIRQVGIWTVGLAVLAALIWLGRRLHKRRNSGVLK
jgi:hypothetical protein